MIPAAQLLGWRDEPGARCAVLILPGGAETGHGRYLSFIDIGLRDLARRLAQRGADDALAVHLLRYRFRGWNGEAADTLVDTRWALAEIEQRHGPVPVALVGHSLGGRAALRAAGDPLVTAVVGMAPWLPPGDPVEQLAGRKVLIVHGDRDRGAAGAARSLAYAERARGVVPDLARFEVAGDNRYLIRRANDCWTAIEGFVLGTVGSAPLPPEIRAAMAAPAPEGLRTPLPLHP